MIKPVICIGTALVDELFFSTEKILHGTSNPAIAKRTAGGVMTNIARHLAVLEVPVTMITVLGNDPDAEWLELEITNSGIDTSNILRVDETTGKYAAMMDVDGSLYTATCSDECGKYLSPEFFETKIELLSNAAKIITDTNLSSESIEWLVDFGRNNNISVYIEPVSVSKARKVTSINKQGVFMMTPNEDELDALCNGNYENEEDYLNELLGSGVQNIWLTKGSQGSLLSSKEGNIVLPAKHLDIIDATGAGDATLAGFIAATYYGFDKLSALQCGHSLAYEVLQQPGAFLTGLNKSKLLELFKKYYPNES